MDEPWLLWRKQQARIMSSLGFLASTWLLVGSAASYAFFSYLTPPQATKISQALHLSVDLGRCSMSLSSSLLAHLAILASLILPVIYIGVRALFDCMLGNGDRIKFLILSSLVLITAVLILLVALSPDALWPDHSPGGRSSRRDVISLANACELSHSRTFFRQYIVYWFVMFVGVLFGLAAMTSAYVSARFGREPEKSAAIQAEIIARQLELGLDVTSPEAVGVRKGNFSFLSAVLIVLAAVSIYMWMTGRFERISMVLGIGF